MQRALSCHEFMPTPSPPGKEEQEGCYKSQRGTFSVAPPSSLWEKVGVEWEA